MQENTKLKIVVASDVDYDDLIVEIYCGSDFIALLQQENGAENLIVEFSPNLKPMSYEWLQDALCKAKNILLGQG